ncbi:MAG: CocE/NonD family hydrolase, partial [Chloroflexi bacterium]|nr:CocE/NonD family hydrolase [Chloroflexota bacterium]
MIIERDLEIPMDDGIILRADLFRPETDEKVPVVMNYGLYGKGLRYQEGYAAQWQWLIDRHPEILDGSTGDYLTWETVDPERWVPAGYAVLRVDSRGAGRSPGLLDPFSPREDRDFYLAIEWAASQLWCNGKVGLCGISYYAMNQWSVAALHPPHLAAIIPWEGAADQYRDVTYHGGILGINFLEKWYPRQVLPVQHGRGVNGPSDPWTGEPATGPETLTEEQLAANRTDMLGDVRRHKLDDDYHRSRSADLAKITVPLLSAANWGGLGLHSRGNFEGFTESSSPQKWLEVHGGRHDEGFLLPYAVALQMRFFDHFLKGEDNGWDRVAPVMLNIRYPDRFEYREEYEWPLARTLWTRLHLDARSSGLSWNSLSEGGATSFEALGGGLTFVSDPLEAQMEITGPINAIFYISSSTSDADLFVTLRAFAPDGSEVDFQGGLDPRTPLAQGWLRASHRRIDPVR